MVARKLGFVLVLVLGAGLLSLLSDSLRCGEREKKDSSEGRGEKLELHPKHQILGVEEDERCERYP